MRSLLIYTTTIVSIVAMPVLFENCLKEENDLASENCTQHCAQITGTLVTSNGTEALANIPLTLVWYYSPGPEQFVIERTKATTKTDNTGQFNFNVTVRDDEITQRGEWQVECVIDTADFCSLGTNSSYFSVPGGVKRDSTVHVDCLIPRKGILSGQIINLNAMQAGDFLSVDFFYHVGAVNGCCDMLKGFYWSPAATIDTYSVGAVAADQPLILDIVKMKDGQRTETTDTITVKRKTSYKYVVTF